MATVGAIFLRSGQRGGRRVCKPRCKSVEGGAPVAADGSIFLRRLGYGGGGGVCSLRLQKRGGRVPPVCGGRVHK